MGALGEDLLPALEDLYGLLIVTHLETLRINQPFLRVLFSYLFQCFK